MIAAARRGHIWRHIAGCNGWSDRQLTRRCEWDKPLYRAIVTALAEYADELRCEQRRHIANGNYKVLIDELRRTDRYYLPEVDKSDVTDIFMPSK